MKKFLVLLTMFVSLPVFAVCPVEGGETVCTLPNFREKFQPVYSPNNSISEFSGSPETRLKPLDKSVRQFNEFTPSGNGNSYNSGCQFGICLQNKSTPLFQRINR